MTTKTRTLEAIERLAVAYHGYLSDLKVGDDCGIVTWGNMLLEAQEATGARLTSPQVTRDVIEGARRRWLATEGNDKKVAAITRLHGVS